MSKPKKLSYAGDDFDDHEYKPTPSSLQDSRISEFWNLWGFFACMKYRFKTKSDLFERMDIADLAILDAQSPCPTSIPLPLTWSEQWVALLFYWFDGNLPPQSALLLRDS